MARVSIRQVIGPHPRIPSHSPDRDIGGGVPRVWVVWLVDTNIATEFCLSQQCVNLYEC